MVFNHTRGGVMTEKIVLIQGEYLGRGDEALGKMLMANFLRLLGESEQKPEQIVFWNDGVKLVCIGSSVLDHLKRLETQGVELLACTTCLEYFDLKDKQVIGKPTTMVKSIMAIMNSDVVSL
jgi:selenium metabolism protein YedF